MISFTTYGEYNLYHDRNLECSISKSRKNFVEKLKVGVLIILFDLPPSLREKGPSLREESSGIYKGTYVKRLGKYVKAINSDTLKSWYISLWVSHFTIRAI